MKTALPFILLALAGIGLSANSQATAQQPTPPYDPAYAPRVAQQTPEMLPPGAINGNPGVNPDVAVAAAPGVPSGPVNDELLIDNGLWEGAQVGPGCAMCGRGSNAAPPEWYVEQDVRILTRNRAKEFGIGFQFTDENTATNTPVGNQILGTESTPPNISGVWGMTFGHYFARDVMNRDHFIEFSFWGLNNWQDEAAFNGGRTSVRNQQGEVTSTHGNLYSGYAVTQVLNNVNANVNILTGTRVPGFDRADRQTTFYTSSTNNFEINGRFCRRDADHLVLHPNGKWRTECKPGWYTTCLYGMRFFQLNEAFAFHSEGRTDIFDPATGQLIDSEVNTGDYNIATHNNLLGLQVGLDLTYHRCRWAWGIHGKVGPYVNFADQESNVMAGPEFAPTLNRRLAWSKHSSSVVGEAGIDATFKFRPNLVGRASYDFMYVSGVALAPEQLQFDANPVSTLNSNGYVILHGVTLGLEWLW